MSLSYEENVKIDTILDLAQELKDVVVKHLKAHGPDPEMNALMIASIVMCINDIDKVIPIRKSIHTMLEEKK